MIDSKKQPDTELYSRQILRLLDLIAGTNKDCKIGRKWKDAFMVRQYEHLKSKFVKELIELLSQYQLTVQIKESEIKEPARPIYEKTNRK